MIRRDVVHPTLEAGCLVSHPPLTHIVYIIVSCWMCLIERSSLALPVERIRRCEWDMAAVFPRIIDGLDKRSYYSESFVEPLLVILGPAVPLSPFAAPPLLYHLQSIAAIAHNATASCIFSYESYFAATVL